MVGTLAEIAPGIRPLARLFSFGFISCNENPVNCLYHAMFGVCASLREVPLCHSSVPSNLATILAMKNVVILINTRTGDTWRQSSIVVIYASDVSTICSTDTEHAMRSYEACEMDWVPAGKKKA
jgi:hypothetical protein